MDYIMTSAPAVAAAIACVGVPLYLFYSRKSSSSSSSSNPRSSRTGSAWERSKSKGGNGYYYGHQATGGYKDGLKQEDFQMNGPRRLDGVQLSKDKGGEGSKKEGKRGEMSRPAYNGGDVPMNAAPKYAGITIDKYSFEDCGALVKLYIRSLPGYENFADGGFKKGDASVYWDDRESLVLLLKRGDGTGETYSLYIKRLFGVVNDVQVVVKGKYLLVKIVKADDKREWTSLVNKVEKVVRERPVHVEGVEDVDDGDGDEGEYDADDYDEEGNKKKKRERKYVNKSDLPFGEDVDEMLDEIYDEIDVGEINI